MGKQNILPWTYMLIVTLLYHICYMYITYHMLIVTLLYHIYIYACGQQGKSAKLVSIQPLLLCTVTGADHVSEVYFVCTVRSLCVYICHMCFGLR